MAEIGENVGADRLVERLDKITLVNDIIDLGNDTRVKNFKSQALGDPALIEAAQKNFDAMDKKFEELRAITRKDIDIKRIDETKAAAAEYKKAMSDLLTNWLALREVGEKRAKVADQVLAAARETATAGIEQTSNIAQGAESSLNDGVHGNDGRLGRGSCFGLVPGVFHHPKYYQAGKQNHRKPRRGLVPGSLGGGPGGGLFSATGGRIVSAGGFT